MMFSSNLSHEDVTTSTCVQAKSAHKDMPPQCGKTGKKEVGALAHKRKCATWATSCLSRCHSTDHKHMLETL